MDIISTANHLQIFLELLQRHLVGTTDLNITVALAQAGKLVEGDSFCFDLVCWCAAFQKFIAVPAPCSLPLALWVHLE